MDGKGKGTGLRSSGMDRRPSFGSKRANESSTGHNNVQYEIDMSVSAAVADAHILLPWIRDELIYTLLQTNTWLSRPRLYSRGYDVDSRCNVLTVSFACESKQMLDKYLESGSGRSAIQMWFHSRFCRKHGTVPDTSPHLPAIRTAHRVMVPVPLGCLKNDINVSDQEEHNSTISSLAVRKFKQTAMRKARDRREISDLRSENSELQARLRTERLRQLELRRRLRTSETRLDSLRHVAMDVTKNDEKKGSKTNVFHNSTHNTTQSPIATTFGKLLKRNRYGRFDVRWARADANGLVYAKREEAITCLAPARVQEILQGQVRDGDLSSLEKDPHGVVVIPTAVISAVEWTRRGSGTRRIFRVSVRMEIRMRQFIFQTPKRDDPYGDAAARWVSTLKCHITGGSGSIQASRLLIPQRMASLCPSRGSVTSSSHRTHRRQHYGHLRRAFGGDKGVSSSDDDDDDETDDDLVSLSRGESALAGPQTSATSGDDVIRDKLRSNALLLPTLFGPVQKRNRLHRWESRWLKITDHKLMYSKVRAHIESIDTAHSLLTTVHVDETENETEKCASRSGSGVVGEGKTSSSTDPSGVVYIPISLVERVEIEDTSESKPHRFTVYVRDDTGRGKAIRFAVSTTAKLDPATTLTKASIPSAQKWVATIRQHLDSFFSAQRLAMRTSHIPVPLAMLCVTWNVNARAPTANLEALLDGRGQNPHLYCVAIQEATKLTTRTVAADVDASFPWRLKIEAVLGPRGYLKVITQHLVGLVLLLYVDKRVVKYISDVSTKTISAGVMGVGGNKGAVCIEFRFDQSKICIVNCHLAAHQERVRQRNQNLAKISHKLNLEHHDNEIVVLMGDLNYRIAIKDKSIVEQIIERRDWPLLLNNDQLLLERAAPGSILRSYSEASINFAPTFKFEVGTRSYERKKGRIPSWCDRVLWKSGPGYDDDNVQCLWYDSVQDYVLSDHLPVKAMLIIRARAPLDVDRYVIARARVRRFYRHYTQPS